MRIVFFVSSFVQPPPVGRTVQFGPQPAGFGSCFVCSIRAAACGVLACDVKELRAFAAGRLRPARPLQGRFLPEASPQPSGWACFRAARGCNPPPGGGCGLPIAARSNLRATIFATASGCRLRRGRFCWPMFTLGLQLAKRLHERTRGAGLRGAKLRPAAASENPQIQHSKF